MGQHLNTPSSTPDKPKKSGPSAPPTQLIHAVNAALKAVALPGKARGECQSECTARRLARKPAYVQKA